MGLNYSPSELLMGRRVKTDIPQTADVLPENSPVWVRTGNTQVPGRVIFTATTPRSYVVSTPTGIIRRNRQHLNPRLNTTDSNSNIDIDLSQDTPSINSQPERDKIMTRTQTGTQIRAPDRLAYN